MILLFLAAEAQVHLSLDSRIPSKPGTGTRGFRNSSCKYMEQSTKRGGQINKLVISKRIHNIQAIRITHFLSCAHIKSTMSGQRLYALTICAYKKEGMDEDEYHRYLSEHHAGLVKTHLAEAGIISYTMVSAFNINSNKCVVNM